MHEEERNLDRHIENMRKSMQVLLEDPAHKGNLYIAEDDIKEIPCFASETLVAVRAPHGTTLEVPDPDEGGDGGDEKRYQIFLKSAAGPVEVFLVSLHDDLEERPTAKSPAGAGGDLSRAALADAPRMANRRVAGPPLDRSFQENWDLVPTERYPISMRHPKWAINPMLIAESMTTPVKALGQALLE